MARFPLFLKETNIQIGDVGLVQTTVNNQSVNDLGYIIQSDHWKKGYAFEMATALLEYGFQQKKLKRIIANMAHDHIGSQKVAEKLGMQRTQTFHNNRNRNFLSYIYSLEK